MRRLTLIVLVAVAFIAIGPGTALAHNSLDSSNPATGAVLETAPTQIAWTFANDVPLDTLTVTLIDPTGVRTELPGSRHGPNGPKDVITPLPQLTPGEYNVRWRLVGADGHPITDTISFTINAAAPTDPTTTVVTPAVAAPVDTSAPPAVDRQPDVDTGDGAWTTPGTLRWIVRALAYIAILTAAGTVLTQRLVTRGRRPSAYGQWLTPALITIAATAAIQLLIVASDITGRPPWSSIGDSARALDTIAGMAFFIRIVLAAAAWVLIVHAPPRTTELRDNILATLAVGLLATWSFAGHSRSMRWPAIGVPLDIVHHGAAAAWLGGLTIIGLLVLPRTKPADVPRLMQRFSTMAGTAVALIVATGIFQAIRLVGNPADLFKAGHGKLLVAKILVLTAMLAIADQNRRRVNLDARNLSAAANPDVHTLRRMIAYELLIGIVVIGLTAALVVSAPATAAGR